MERTDWTPGELAADFYGLIYTVCRDYLWRHPISGMEASDLAQETAVRLVKRWKGSLPVGCLARQYVIVNARRTCSAARRNQYWQCRNAARAASAELLWNVLDSDTRSPIRNAIHRERLEGMRQAAAEKRLAPRLVEELADAMGVDVLADTIDANTVNTDNAKRRREAIKQGSPTYRLTCWQAGRWVDIDDVTPPLDPSVLATKQEQERARTSLAEIAAEWRAGAAVRRINRENAKRRKLASKRGEPTYWLAGEDGSDVVEVTAPCATT